MEELSQIVFKVILFGLLAGSIYSLFAVGLTLIMGVGRILNISHGDLGILGAYIAYWFFVIFGLDPLLSLIIIIPLLAIIGMSVQRFLISPAITNPKFRIVASVMITYGLALFISNGETIVWTPGYKFLELPYSYSGFEILSTTINIPRLIVLITSAVVSISLIILLRTKLGKTIQASAQDQMLAELVGINCNRVAMITFGISTAVAGIGGVLYILNHPLYPAVGLHLSLKALTVMVLGGIGNVMGALVAGLILGLAESYTSFFIGDLYRELVTYMLLVAVLLIRPSGIFKGLEI